MNLHVGIDNYEDGRDALTVCGADARSMSDLFGGRMVLDKEATLENLDRLYRQVVSDRPASRGGWRIITHSGHGSWDNDQPKGDEPDKRDECVVTYDCYGLFDDTIGDIFRSVSGPLLFITDSCHSETVFTGVGPEGPPPGLVKSVKPNKLKPLSRLHINSQQIIPNVVHVYACRDKGVSYEGKGHGVLIGALLKTFNPKINLYSWFGLAFESIRRDYPGWQQPGVNGADVLLTDFCSELMA